MNYFCTFFDAWYLPRGVALYNSLILQKSPFHLWMLCMDSESAAEITSRSLAHVTVVTVKELERNDHRLTVARNNRSLIEFYFSSKPFLCRYIFDICAEVKLLTYLDADFFFFDSPNIILAEMSGYSVGLTSHRFPPQLRHLEQHGIFNAGFISFRRDEDGLSCLSWWSDRCFEWCHDYVDNGRFADQRYLDLMPQLFQKVRCIEHKGINLAPWNISRYDITQNGGKVLIDTDSLILYHFHNLKRINNLLYDTGLSLYKTRLTAHSRKFIYIPYLDMLQREEGAIQSRVAGKGIRVGKEKYPRIAKMFPTLLRICRNALSLIKVFYFHSLICYRTKY